MKREEFEGSIEDFMDDAKYFVENDGYATLAGVREELDLAVSYSSRDTDGAEELLEKGDELLVDSGKFSDELEERKEKVEEAIEEYRKAVAHLGQDQDYLLGMLDTAEKGIKAGINQGILGERERETFSGSENGLVNYTAD